ncbi:MAG: MotE family protein [Pseudobdellovibrionaceae bacterium]
MSNGYDQFFKKARKNAENSKTSFMLDKKIDFSEDFKNQTPVKKTTQNKKRKYKLNWKMAGLSFIGLIISILSFINQDKIEYYVRHIELKIFSWAEAEEKSSAVESKLNSDNGLKKNGNNNNEESSISKSSEQKNNEEEFVKKEIAEIDHIAHLEERKKQLEKKEEELSTLEISLQKEKLELQKRLDEIENTRRQISSVLEEKVKFDEKKVDSLVAVYSKMKPINAAKIFETLDENLAIEILAKMNQKNAAEILNLIKTEKAQIFSEKFAGYKK